MKKRLLALLPPVLLFFATVALFAPSVGYMLVNLDDPIFIVNNPIVFQGFSWPALGRAFTELHADKAMYTPLLWVSYLLDSLVFHASPVSPWGYHLTNVLLHAANAVLLFFILRTAVQRPWVAFFAAAFWALHPLRVESVAWVTERKDTLSTLFAFASVLFYLHARGRGRPARDGGSRVLPSTFHFSLFTFHCGKGCLCLALAAFVAGVLSKPMLVTLPFLFLLLDWWPLRRFSLRGAPRALPRLAAEKWPFFLVSLLAAVLTYRLQADAIANVPLAVRLLRLPVNYFFYVSRTCWPVGLCPLAPGLPATLPWVAAASAFFLVLAATAMLLFRRVPGFPLGLLAFAGLLFPVCGIVYIGTVPVADRYAYLPSLGLSLALAALLAAIRPRHPAVAAAPAAAVLLAFAAVSLRILPAWKDPDAFARRAEQVVPGHSLALMDRFNHAFYKQGDVQAANEAADAIWAQEPFTPFAVLVKVLALSQISSADAVAFHETHPAVRMDPETRDTLSVALATLYADLGDFAKANPLLDEILAKTARYPKYAEVVSAIAFWAFASQGLDDRAAAIARAHPGMDRGRPLCTENFLLSATSIWNLGFRRQALPRLLRLADDAPGNPALLNNVAWLLATPPNSPANPADALAIARRALDLAPDNPVLRDTHAVCLAFAGQFDEAARIEAALADSLRSSTAADAPALRAHAEECARLFRARTPYTENSPAILLYAR